MSNIWVNCLEWWGVFIVMIEDLIFFFEVWMVIFFISFDKKLWVVVFFVFIWFIYVVEEFNIF